MECNKEEALRAMAIAEKKMETKDFVAAKKIALKAQKLCPALENISQMLTVCEVHCAASMQVNGTVDWYRILQVDGKEDESVIKKQYRKLALLLHPDKNKFAGAEAAFKLIGEAHLTLTDKGKRSLYDIKRNAFRAVTSRSQCQTQYPNQNSYVRVHPAASNKFGSHASHARMHESQKQKEAHPSGSQTFWTTCPFCAIKYQYYLNILNRNVICRNCCRNFTAFDLNTQGSFMGMNQNSNQQGNSGFSNVRFQGNTSVKPTVSEPSRNVGTGDRSTDKVKEDSQMDNDPANENKANFQKINLKDAKNSGQIPDSHGNPKAKKRRKSVAQSSDTESSDSEEEVKGYDSHAKNVDTSVYQNPRRSTRQKQKQNVTYNESLSDDEHGTSDDDFVSSLKRPKMDASSCQSDHTDKVHLGSDEAGDHNGDSQTHEREVEEEKISMSETNSKVNTDSSENDDLLSFPDTEFYDFQKNRNASLFASNQIWALYDDLDGMPRFYARIKNVFSRGFKVQYTWLEYDPSDQSENEWSCNDLPVGCGIFKLGKTQSSEALSMFSHIMFWENGPRKNSYVLHPKKGEIWALYKDWNINWKSDPENHRSYKYEVVEVLSDYTHATGVIVARLIKVKGFVSLFARAIDEENDVLKMLPNEILKFSHMVPSYKMSGEERKGIPQGSYELDTGSLPPNLDIVFPSISFEQINVKVEDKFKRNSEACSDPSVVKKHEEDIREHLQSNAGDVLPNNVSETFEKDRGRTHHSSGPVFFEYPDTEFNSFESEKNTDRFQSGQIWALYSDTDGFPSYYAMVTKVEINPFKVHVTWLDVCPMLAEEIKWYKKNLNLGSGKYKVLFGKMYHGIYDNAEAFSHQVNAEAAEKKNHYYIYPNVGQVWAVYKNWNIGWEKSDVDQCEYDLVEVISRTSSVIKVKFLEKVKGYFAVFKQRRDVDGNAFMEFPRSGWIRFSHCIPSFRLSEERGGKLRDCWELDPASVPEILLCTGDP